MRRSSYFIAIAILVQCALLVVLNFGDIGFDKPGRYGLDFEHFLVILALYVFALLAGIVVSAMRKLWGVIALQLVPTVFFLATNVFPAIR
jgi:hypothetical protein